MNYLQTTLQTSSLSLATIISNEWIVSKTQPNCFANIQPKKLWELPELINKRRFLVPLVPSILIVWKLQILVKACNDNWGSTESSTVNCSPVHHSEETSQLSMLPPLIDIIYSCLSFVANCSPICHSAKASPSLATLHAIVIIYNFLLLHLCPGTNFSGLQKHRPFL